MRKRWMVPAGAALLVVLAGSLQAADAPGPASGIESSPKEESPCVERIQQLQEQGRRVEPLIVTLPDPVGSHFAREFDVLLAALSRGLGSLGYVRDLYCMPWSTDPDEESSHEERPGLVLFTGSEAVVAALLVGETPLAGVHAGAMEAALKQAEAMVDTRSDAVAEEGDVTRTVKILGPTFSGSASSINLALNAWGTTRPADGPPTTVRIRSGSATVNGLGEILRRNLGPGDPQVAVESYRSLTASNLDLQSCVWNRFVPERLGLRTRLPPALNDRLPEDHPCAPPSSGSANADADNGRVALLVESSAYGRDFQESGFHVLPFPMHVWRLRELYEKQRVEQKPSSEVLSEAAAAPEIELERRPRGIPAFGGGATLASQDMILNGILRDLARKRFEVIGVVASDVIDKRFLAERLQELAPGSRVITFEGDVLLADSRNGRSPSGVLVASSYPVAWPETVTETEGSRTLRVPSAAARGALVAACNPFSPASSAPAPAFWFEPDDRGPSRPPPLRFPMDAAQGLYHAARELISGSRGAPPQSVWLSLIGNGDLYTLERIQLDEPPPSRPREPTGEVSWADSLQLATLAPPTLPRGWWLLLSLATLGFLLALGHVARCLWPKADGWWVLLGLLTLGLLPALAAGTRKLLSRLGRRVRPAEAPGSPEPSGREAEDVGRESEAGARDDQTEPDRPLIFGLIPVELVRRPPWRAHGDPSGASDRALHALVALIPVVVGIPYLILSVPVLSGSLGTPGSGAETRSVLAVGWVGNMPPFVVALLFGITLYLLAGLGLRTLSDLWRLDAHPEGPAKSRRGRLATLSSWTRNAGAVALPFLVTVCLFFVALILGYVWIEQSWLDDDSALTVARSLGLSSGVSPLMPSLLLGSVLLGWIVLSLFRHRVRRAIPTREEIDDLAAEGVDEVLRSRVTLLRRAIDPASLWQGAGLLWTMLVGAPVLYLMLFYERAFTPPLRSVEGASYDWAASTLFLVALVVAVGAGISLLRGWTALRGLLEWLRLSDGADQEQDGWLERVRKAYTEAGDSRTVAETRRREALRALETALEEADGKTTPDNAWKRLFQCGGNRGSEETDRTSTPYDWLRRALAQLNERFQERPAGRWLVIAGWRERLTAQPGGREVDTELEAAAREFFVWSAVRFIRDAFVQLLQLMGFMTAGLLLLLVAVTVYPFEPQRVLLIYLSSLVGLGAVLSVWVAFQIRSEKLLGALEGEETGSWNALVRRLGVYAGLPVVSILASRFPEVRHVFGEWIAPLFKAFG